MAGTDFNYTPNKTYHDIVLAILICMPTRDENNNGRFVLNDSAGQKLLVASIK